MARIAPSCGALWAIIATRSVATVAAESSPDSELATAEPGENWPPPQNARIPLYEHGTLGQLRFFPSCSGSIGKDSKAQRYMDQGYQLLAAFDMARATMSFRAASKEAGGDSGCPLCVFGEALALGPNLNTFDEPMLMRSVPLAYQRAKDAANVYRETKDVCRDLPCAQRLFKAMGERYAPTAADYVAREHALTRKFAEQMTIAAAECPDNADVKAFAADAWMNTHPWDYWLPSDQSHELPDTPRPETSNAIALLQDILQRLDPKHAFAVHLYIHITEASAYHARALPYAKVFPRLMPAAPHVQHMAFHTLMHSGGYILSEEVNQEASEMPRQIYPMHNLDTLAWVCRIEGRRKCALSAAARLERVATASAKDNLFETGFPASRFATQLLLTRVAFGMDDHIVAAPAPPSYADSYWHGIWHFARGVAHARRGNCSQAESEFALLESSTAQAKADSAWPGRGPPWAFANFGGNHKFGTLPAVPVLQMAEAELDGYIAMCSQQKESAVEFFRRASEIEDSLPYDEPPTWYLPMSGRLGYALLAAGQAEAAAGVYNNSLRAYPRNGWARMTAELTKGLNVLLLPRFEELTQRCDKLDARCRELQRNVDIKEEREEVDRLRAHVEAQIAQVDNVVALVKDRFSRLDEQRSQEIHSLRSAVDGKAEAANTTHIHEQLSRLSVIVSKKADTSRLDDVVKQYYALSEDVAQRASAARAEHLTKQLQDLSEVVAQKVDCSAADRMNSQIKTMQKELGERTLVSETNRVSNLLEELASRSQLKCDSSRVDEICRRLDAMTHDLGQKTDMAHTEHINRTLNAFQDTLANKADALSLEQTQMSLHEACTALDQKAEGTQHEQVREQLQELRGELFTQKGELHKVEEMGKQVQALHANVHLHSAQIKNLAVSGSTPQPDHKYAYSPQPTCGSTTAPHSPSPTGLPLIRPGSR